MTEPEIQITADGSHTLYIPELNEHYHSINGAVQESLHVYIDAGFNQCTKHEIRILELGFGTGLNALLTCMEGANRQVTVHYTTLEKYPLTENIIQKLNYSKELPQGLHDIFQQIHTCNWNTSVNITPYFSLNKINTDICSHIFTGSYDVVFYDAFAPDKQPEAWSQEIFDQLYNCMNPEGVLTTYCAKGSIRRMMKSSGFIVERIPGPPGKREMLRARKTG